MNVPELPGDSDLAPAAAESTGEEKKHPSGSGLLQLKLNNFFRLLVGPGAREGYLASVDQALISLSNFIATIIIARNVSPTELGVYGVGFTTLRLIRSVQEGLTIQPLNSFGAGEDALQLKRYATSTSIIQLGFAVGTAAIFFFSGVVLTRLGNDLAGPTMASLWFPVFFWQLQEYIRRMLYARGQISSAVTNTVLANVPRLILLAWWARMGNLSGVKGLDAIAWGALIALFQGLIATRHFWTRKFDNLRTTWLRNWDFGRWVIGGNVANWISVEFYPVLTAGLISFAAAGAYRALQNVVAPIQLLLRAVDTFLLPRAARIFKQSGWPELMRTLRLIYIFSGIPIFLSLAFIVIFRTQILFLLYGTTYLEYSNGVILLAIFYAFWFASTPIQTTLEAIRLSRPIFIANLFAILAMFTVGIWMIDQWGVYGTMTGQILNAMIVCLILAWAWRVVRRSPAIGPL